MALKAEGRRQRAKMKTIQAKPRAIDKTLNLKLSTLIPKTQ
jgi:hypothetical protein